MWSLSSSPSDPAATMAFTVANVAPPGTLGPPFTGKWPLSAAGQTPGPSGSGASTSTPAVGTPGPGHLWFGVVGLEVFPLVRKR